MKFIKWGTLVIILFVIVVSGVSYMPFFNHSDTQKPIEKLSAMAKDLGTTKYKQPEKPALKTIANLGLQAKSVILIDAKSGEVLYEKNSDQALPTASMSKMMTEFLVLEAIHNQQLTWNQTVKISDYVDTISNHPGFASVHLQKGRPYTIRELFEATAIHSANGAAIALAEAVAGSEKAFVVKMNKKAEAFGLKETHFVDSTGLDNRDLGKFFSTGTLSDTNRMSAKDLAQLARQLIVHYPEILNITDQPKLQFEQQSFMNTNLMLPARHQANLAFDGVDGLKTGFTDEAGYCFVGTVKRNDVRLISVVMGATSSTTRFSETKRLYTAAFAK
ncbi:D-alanyl-D-alanine carboxypeptidase (penicillin-binding protein 5/6) [Pullulanibacillus pueri]|uniref:Peptidase S11 D-alanyl-D-alanine carboxypeptidase A N-terminal domain-containing protein n=1 Tax=Pullulanibacillus pueri TaxID=1437324 RepID=A0A8J3ENF8_9BACL|nr:D-alanyl-D-alanine carboxypeptidase family protein [Pullulanibacillus pueri]MBM7683888.1 D-alanyl-D-alanine carboxypeptidase (penicillin-binding protein 5/6) [Pullulanibacillus pueri]GGH87871.1 hypothetical protein GCM10007096_38890 [Pullulanibacillus pueri]